MISRRIRRSPEHDNYRRLARYIADASHDGEKLLMSWCAGCWSGDDEYDLAIGEVESTQALNTRTTREKTYHLMISFRPEDEARLSPDIFKVIELEFAQALGFEKHQRHCGVHKNTDNIHLHIAYNQIHPERRTRHEPYFDYLKRDKLCRELERKYGLSADNGRDPETQKPINDAAMTFEAKTGQESLFGYAQRHKQDILSLLSNARSWEDCHSAFIKFGLSIKPHGNGLVLQTIDGRHSIKASDLDRSASKIKLEKRFGLFKSAHPELFKTAIAAQKYSATPLHKEPDRDNLYDLFKEAMAKRQAALAEIGKQDARLYAIYKDGWVKKRTAIKKIPMMCAHRQKVMEELRAREKAERDALRKAMGQKRATVWALYPFNSWSKFLRHQAEQGNETALAILRSKKSKIQPARPNQPDLSQRNNSLAAVSNMLELFKREGLKEPQYTIDAKGTIIFKLPDGGSIRDAGAEIHYSHGYDQAERLAHKLAQFRWGQSVAMAGSVLRNSLFIHSRQQQVPSGLSSGDIDR